MASGNIFLKDEISIANNNNIFYVVSTNNSSTAVDGRMKLSTIKNFINEFDDSNVPITASTYQRAIEILSSPEFSVISSTSPFIYFKETDDLSNGHKIQSNSGNLDIFRTDGTSTYSSLLKFNLSGNSAEFNQSEIRIKSETPKINFLNNSGVSISSIENNPGTLEIKTSFGGSIKFDENQTESTKPISIKSTMILDNRVSNSDMTGIWFNDSTKEWNFQNNSSYRNSSNSGIKSKFLKVSNSVEFNSNIPASNNRIWEMAIEDSGTLNISMVRDDKSQVNKFLSLKRTGENSDVLEINSDVLIPVNKLLYSKKTGNNYNGIWVADSGIVHFITNSPKNTLGNSILACSNISFDGGNSLAFSDGTWIPSIKGSSTVGTPTYTERVGKWRRIGKIIFLSFSITISDFNGTGDIFIDDLPFPTEDSFGSFSIIRHSGIDLPIGSQLSGEAITSFSKINLLEQKNDSSDNLSHTMITDSVTITGNFTYRI